MGIKGFETSARQLGCIPLGGRAVTPNDSADLPGGTCLAITVGTAGMVKATMDDGSTPTFYVAAGIQFAGAFRRIWSTGTAAASIVAWY